MQNSCLRYIFGIRKFEHVSHKLEEVGWLNMYARRELTSLCLFHKIIVQRCPRYLFQLITFRSDVHNINVRHRGCFSPPAHRLYLRDHSNIRYTAYITQLMTQPGLIPLINLGDTCRISCLEYSAIAGEGCLHSDVDSFVFL